MLNDSSPIRTWRAWGVLAVVLAVCWIGSPGLALANDEGQTGGAGQLDFRQMFEASGVIGIIIIVLSVIMVALIIEHLLSIRRNALMPPGLADDVHRMINAGQFQDADQLCRSRPSFLSHVLTAGLAEINLGYTTVEKAMEDASTEQSARLFRKIEYLSVIGSIAPMLGLLGTVWGMILAFMEFETKANPQVAELAPGIYRALITTLMGLVVAVPASACFAIFRNRIDELVAESSLLAEHIFADFRRTQARKKAAAAAASRRKDETGGSERPGSGIPPVGMTREKGR